jgi:8-oxo-dGTP diphosphatase
VDAPARTIRIAAAVVVDSGGRLLLVRKHGTTAFIQPGGKLDPGESPLDAVRREVHEELGVAISSAETRALGRHVARAANEPDHLVDADVFAVTLLGEPRAAAEIAELVWIDPLAPGEIELAPLTRDVVFGLLRS